MAETKPQPQISEMFQKFALAFKSKTVDLFSDAGDEPKLIILKPDPPSLKRTLSTPNPTPRKLFPLDTQLALGLISSIFATVSSFEASYLRLQASHAPFNEESLRAADESLVSHLKKLSEFKNFYKELRFNPGSGVEFLIGSCLEAQVEDNQSKLRLLGFVSDRLQAEIDHKEAQVSAFKKELGDLMASNSSLSKRLLLSNNRINVSDNYNVYCVGSRPCSCGVVLSLKVFVSVLNDVCGEMRKFSKILIALMRKAGWDLDLAANSVCNGFDYSSKSHNRYAFLSYVCLGMFRGFDFKGFGLDDGEGDSVSCNGDDGVNGIESGDKSSLSQLIDRVCNSRSLELLTKNPDCGFSRFCEKKYQELVHPTMESSIFRDLDGNEVVLSSWRSLSAFYGSFVNMASSLWTLHMLAHSFDPVVEIFQVERGGDFSIVYMEDVTRKFKLPAKTRAKVGFTVVPGFKIGRTVVQAQVYLCGFKCTE